MSIPTEAIGSIPRSERLMALQRQFDAGQLDPGRMEAAYEEAVLETLHELEATGSTLISDGEQRKTHSFASYSVDGGANFALDGVAIPFADGHVRHLPRLTQGPFKFNNYAFLGLEKAIKNTQMPMKYGDHLRVRHQPFLSPRRFAVVLQRPVRR